MDGIIGKNYSLLSEERAETPSTLQITVGGMAGGLTFESKSWTRNVSRSSSRLSKLLKTTVIMVNLKRPGARTPSNFERHGAKGKHSSYSSSSSDPKRDRICTRHAHLLGIVNLSGCRSGLSNIREFGLSKNSTKTDQKNSN
jgi:hypothetical protein